MTPDFELPKTLGPYVLVSELGRGTTGTVYLAQQTYPIERLVATKIPTDGRTARSMREVRIQAALQHPAIALLHDAIEVDGTFFWCRQYVDGADFAELIRQNGLSLKDAMRIMSTIALGVRAVHAQGLIHNNLDASNVLVASNGTAKLVGFGRAKARDDDPAVGLSQVSADISALGEMLVSAAQRLGKPLPEMLEAIAMKCEKAGSDWGYKSAAELVEDLERFSRGQ
jgi:eukaryotic-like serine/threonine-protein kinase